MIKTVLIINILVFQHKIKNFFKTKKKFKKNHTLTFREEEVKEPEIKEYTNKELNKKIKK